MVGGPISDDSFDFVVDDVKVDMEIFEVVVDLEPEDCEGGGPFHAKFRAENVGGIVMGADWDDIGLVKVAGQA